MKEKNVAIFRGTTYVNVFPKIFVRVETARCPCDETIFQTAVFHFALIGSQRREAI
jgi:hypothetical protein